MIRRILAARRRPADPQVCLACRTRQDRHTPAQRAQLAARLTPSCPHCDGPVVHVAFVELVEATWGPQAQAWGELGRYRGDADRGVL